MAENNLIGGVNSIGGANYPTFQPMPQPGGMGQLNDMLSLARNAQGLQQQQFELGQKRTMFVADRLGSLLTKPDLSITDAQDMVGDMVRNQIIPASEAPAILQHFPQDPTQLRAAVKQSYLSTLAHTDRMNLAFRAPVTQDQGGATLYGSRDVMNPGDVRLPGITQSAGGTALPMTTSPAQRITPYIQPTPGGPVNTTVGAAAASTGMDPNYGVPRAALKGSFAPQGQPQGGYPPPGQTLGTQGTPLLTEPGIKAITEDQATATTKAQAIQPLLQALPLLEKGGLTSTGPGTQTWNDIKGFFIAQGVLGQGVSDVEARNEIDKYLKQYVSKSSYAGTTDYRTAAQEAASPNTTTQINPATIRLVKNAIAYDRMEVAKPAAFSEDQPISKYGAHRSTFTQAQDADAYKLDLMSPQDRQTTINKNTKMLSSGKPGDVAAAKKFFDSLRNADKAGVLNIAPGQ